MIYRFRIILDAKEDILRDIEIEASATLEDFHYAIAQAFGFAGSEMASFYRTNEAWEQGEEIPLLDMDEGIVPMGQEQIDSIFTAENHHLIYVYDFLALWTFFVELIEVGEPEITTLYPNLIFAQGEVPEEAPQKDFVADESTLENEMDEEEEEGLEDYNDADFY
ncbi:plasmid pRiA4b ORF-3 family protein [Flavobacteriaceae bacterium]|uniref:plasmid pRiA4b ORF-3 family protein n=1 Tax=Candidatus Arcticimaribacter forsetii TaxID=2820661 RepID=UPI0020770FE3|nr:plasmid pRiA4b ORF-3 family protein [Candidatus Arcticimaribacter forsetii]MDA8640478.1 plasmid pRiA4b ORF-3 family protein [Flavobacteriaceae bacterium]MDA8699044.1 plasmid pRiA4b ORF-3 family protein [Flavobacteriaceae bacterium]MDB4674905.1 plasmid pRiA4b ORF-3 family protein [Flavobacteriaceae bacterium]